MSKVHSIVTAPTVTVVASSRMSALGIHEFIRQQDLTAILELEAAPLTKMVSNIHVNANDPGDQFAGDYTDGELLPEFAGRFCYRSFSKGRDTEAYHANIMEERHGSILEHTSLSLAITGVSRSLTHELIRHRSGVAISQESQRYVNANDIKFVIPPIQLHYYGMDSGETQEWHAAQIRSVEEYEKWQELLGMSIMSDDDLSDDQARTLKKKRANEAARANLPNSCETKLVWTANLRTLRHVILTRGADPADLEVRRLAVELAIICKQFAPTIFADIEIRDAGFGDFGVPTVHGTHWKV